MKLRLEILKPENIPYWSVGEELYDPNWEPLPSFTATRAECVKLFTSKNKGVLKVSAKKYGNISEYRCEGASSK
jgi:hypothetical protein